MQTKTRTRHLSIGLLVAMACPPSFAGDLIKIDGSSTVYPITRAVADDFVQSERGKTAVAVGISGTGGGFSKFCRGEIDVANASRPIKEKEKRVCADNGISFIELPVALDAITVVVNKFNDWAESMTVEELKTAWHPASENRVTQWNDINNGYPTQPLKLHGPGIYSGTYDYFIKAVVGERMSRRDYEPNEDDHVLANAVANDINAMAFFGMAYYERHRDKLKAVSLSWRGKPAVKPSNATARSGLYQPLSRPVFIYVNKRSAVEHPFVSRFVNFYLDSKRITNIVQDSGYVALPASGYNQIKSVFQRRQTGTVFNGAEIGISIEELLKRKAAQ